MVCSSPFFLGDNIVSQMDGASLLSQVLILPSERLRGIDRICRNHLLHTLVKIAHIGSLRNCDTYQLVVL